MITLPRSVVLLAFGAILFAVGCSRNLGASANGTVTLDGKPLTTGNVTYIPQASGVPGYATIRPDGTYFVTTGDRTGIAPGEYTITVVAREAATVENPGDMPTPGKAIVPERYASAETSGLKHTVARGMNRIDLNLKSTP